MFASETRLENAYLAARDAYAAWGMDTEQALRTLEGLAVSVHCWQGDDVAGFEAPRTQLGGGLAVTGTYPGRARTGDELRSDLAFALRLIPGRHRLNLHASYAEPAARTERNALEPAHFTRWVDWAREHTAGIDFNPTFFGHPLADDGFTLSHADPGIRRFWIEHGQACRDIGAALGRQLGSPCVTNVWIPDGCKDAPADRVAPRWRLLAALDEMFAPVYPAEHLLDAVESKLFGLGSESYVVGSHEFYLGYAITRNKVLCLDSGHFHPTEQIADKISAVMPYVDRLLLHISRGIRWDSDHVVTFSDDVRAIAEEVVRGKYLPRVHLGLDYFDASINRVAAWVIGTRALLKALLVALLEPSGRLRAAEASGDYTERLALNEEFKTLPWAAVWDYYCWKSDVPVGAAWLAELRRYEQDVLAQRG